MITMQENIKIEIPREWVKGLPDDDLTVRHIVRLGIRQMKVERAIRLYEDGVGSLGYIAGQLEMTKTDLIREMRLRNIEPEFSEETVAEELASCQ